MEPKDARPVVYLTSGIFGYLYRFFPIGRALSARGHSVVVVTPSREAAEHAAAAGFGTHVLEREAALMDSLPDASWPRPWRTIARRIPGVALGPRSSARRHWEQRSAVMKDGTEINELLSALEPKLVVTEAEEHRTIRIVLAGGHDVILFEDLYSARPGPDVPFPARSHQVPTGSQWSRARASAGWRWFFVSEAMRRRAERWWVDGHDWHSTLGVLAVRAGLRDTTISRRYFQFYDYLDLPRIRTVAPELAFPGEPQPEAVVGPVVDVDRVVHDVDETFAERWSDVLRRRADGARIVYVSVGTFLSGMEQLTEQVIEAARAIPDVEVVVSVGRDRDRWAGADLPRNVAVFGRVPQIRLLADADVVVSTGGLNTGHEALWFGVPVLNLPIAGLDTPGNSARLAFHGVGRRLTPRQIDVARIRAELSTLLDDSRYRERARDLGADLRRWNAVAGAVDAIEARLTQP